ncbi:MAG: hypothetical protein ACT4N2_03525 [Hyphomicrobium sp.]
MRNTSYFLMVVLALMPGASTAAAEILCDVEVGSYDILEAKISGRQGVKLLPSDAATRSYEDPQTSIIWNFATKGSPAYPSVACRRLNTKDGTIFVVTEISCRAAKDACDRLAAAYSDLDRQMTEALKKK